MDDEMTNDQFDAFLESLAQLIEAKAKTPAEAADLVRDKKTKKPTAPTTAPSNEDK